MRFAALLFAAAIAVYAQASDDRPLTGLAATYSDGTTRVRTVAAAPQLHLEPGESIHPALKPAFEAEWTGLISILAAGDYTFDPGPVELRINGAAVGTTPVSLSAGRHPITMKYRRTPGTAVVRLMWRAAHFAPEPVPGSILFHARTETPGENDTLVARGRYLAEELGCVNCHRSGAASLEGRLGPDLTAAGSRMKPEWIHKWLDDPQAFRPGAAMPGIAGAQDRRDIATYFASLRDPSAAPARRSRSGSAGLGISLFGSIGCSACHGQDEHSLDGMGSKTTAPALVEYLKNPAKFDPSGRMPSLMLTEEESQSLAAYLVDLRKPEFEQPFTAGDATRGKALVESEGCIACHALNDGAPAVNRQTARPLDRVAAGRGCLAPDVNARLPQYRLTAEDRTALNAFVGWYRAHPDVSPAPVHRLETSLRQFQCVACHELDGQPPTATLPEATPPLMEAGAKLRGSWIGKVLTGHARSRSWQTLRMPDYAPHRVSGMAVAFAKAAGVEPGEGPGSLQLTAEQTARGAGFLGTDPKRKGMACIGCHDWGGHKSLGEDGPQLIDTAERLRYDWYQRWMLDPARIHSGTSMPNYFTSMDRRSAADVIDSLWAAFRASGRIDVPAGFGNAGVADDREARPQPGKRPVVVRWDMPEATPAAIAVGLPGKLSYCFDAGESRLRYAWRGGFLDLSETLVKKTDANRLTPTAKLIGDVFYRSDGFPIRVGSADREPPRRFRGYRLVDGHLEFRYEVDGIEVSERIVAADGSGGLVRHFTVSKVDQPMWFVDGARRMDIPRGSGVRFSVEAGQ